MLSRKLKYVSLTIGFGLLFPLGATQAQASALNASDYLPDPQLALKGELEDRSGNALKVLSEDASSDGEVTYTVESQSGMVSSVRIQYSSVTDLDREQMREAMAAPIPETGYTLEAPVAEKVEVMPELLPESVEWTAVSAIVTAADAVSVAWKDKDFSLQVIGEGEIASDDGVATLSGLDSNTTYEASIAAVSDISEKLELVEQRNFTFQTAAEGGAVSSRAALASTTAYVHKTFIPDARVPGWGCTLNAAVTFGGDNRSWQTPTPAEPGGSGQKFRTQMFANINWANPVPNNFYYVKNVGATTVYINNVLQSTVYADMSNMSISASSVGTNYAKALFDHTAGNPGCTFMGAGAVGSIRYYEWVEFYRSGTVAVDGYRFKAPAHEMYARLDDWNWKTVSLRSNEGFECLLGNGACGLDFYTVSAS